MEWKQLGLRAPDGVSVSGTDIFEKTVPGPETFDKTFLGPEIHLKMVPEPEIFDKMPSGPGMIRPPGTMVTDLIIRLNGTKAQREIRTRTGGETKDPLSRV